ncbi:MAG: hypothetical protein FWD76_02690 [Firmicutes bacterium]|nr:hypothetical protein [Bacillota bacterium]
MDGSLGIDHGEKPYEPSESSAILDGSLGVVHNYIQKCIIMQDKQGHSRGFTSFAHLQQKRDRKWDEWQSHKIVASSKMDK